MAKYKFDGKFLAEGTRNIAKVASNDIITPRNRTIGRINADRINCTSNSTLFNVIGDKIYKGSGSSAFDLMADVNKAIDVPGKVVKAALWVLCCH